VDRCKACEDEFENSAHVDKLKSLTERQKQRFKGWTFKSSTPEEIKKGNEERDKAIAAGAPF
jgi:hypothetical protein